MSYRKEIFISFSDADPQGILYFARFYQKAHQVIESMICSSGITWDFWFNNPNWMAPLKHTEADHFSPLKAGCAYDVEVKIKRLGTTSVTFESSFFDKEKLAATVSTTHVFVDRQSMTKREIPPEIRKILEAI